MEKGLENATVEQDKAQGKKTKIRVEAGASFQKKQIWTVWFHKPEHPISPGSVQQGNSRTIVSGMTSVPHWCPPGLTPSQRRRIQRMRAH
jgi:hypothetical protein